MDAIKRRYYQCFSGSNLGIDYYNISYFSEWANAYAVVAIEDNTHVYHDGTLTATLNNAGEVYYKTTEIDMTGAHIASDKPVALFLVNNTTTIPVGYAYNSSLFQQLAPVHTWGKTFFVPVSHRTKDIVRIVASENNTNITQTGGTLLFPAGGQTSLDNLQAGQFVEL